MDNSKLKRLSPTDIDQLLAAVRELDRSIDCLKKLLQQSVKLQTETGADEDATALLPDKVLH